MNRRAVELSMRVGMALGCEAPDFTKWDRKSYYYPDLPKGYQLSQYDLPLNVNGHLEVLLSDGTTKDVRILRAHLEEDAGKNVHDNPTHTGVDLNRAGVPLLEIVSQPDMNSAEETVAFGRAMQRLVRWLGASEANMQMGHMRFEPNINIHVTRGGVTYKTPIIEVKNLNSFRSLENAVRFEIDRQYAQWLTDNNYTMENFPKQNRGYDDATEQTVFQRGKEEAHDYRYFPDPDLVPVLVDDRWRSSIAESIGELPMTRRARYIEQYNLTFKEADALTMDAATGDLLDIAVSDAADPKRCVNLLLGRGAATANERRCTIAEIGITAEQLGELAKMLEAEEVNATAAARIFDKLVAEGGSAKTIAQTEGLLAVTDTGSIEAWVAEAVDSNPNAVDGVRSGGKKAKKAFGFLMGQVMQKSRGAANPAKVRELLNAKLEQ